MGAQGLQDQVGFEAAVAHLCRQQVAGQRVGDEVGLAAGGVPASFAGGVAEVEATGMADAAVEVGETGDGVGDQLADALVVGDQRVPVHRMVAQGCLGDAGDDRRLRTHLLRERLQLPVGCVDHAERVFHRDRLRAFGLAVDVGAPQAGQDQCVAAGGQVAAVELGADVHGQVA